MMPSFQFFTSANGYKRFGVYELTVEEAYPFILGGHAVELEDKNSDLEAIAGHEFVGVATVIEDDDEEEDKD